LARVPDPWPHDLQCQDSGEELLNCPSQTPLSRVGAEMAGQKQIERQLSGLKLGQDLDHGNMPLTNGIA